MFSDWDPKFFKIHLGSHRERPPHSFKYLNKKIFALDQENVLRRVDTPLYPLLMNIKSLTWNESALKVTLRGNNKMCARSFCRSNLSEMMIYAFLDLPCWNITSQNLECD